MIFPIKNAINIELFIDKKAALHILASQIRDQINKGDQPVALAGWRLQYTLRWKGVGTREQAVACIKMSLKGMWQRQKHLC